MRRRGRGMGNNSFPTLRPMLSVQAGLSPPIVWTGLQTTSPPMSGSGQAQPSLATCIRTSLPSASLSSPPALPPSLPQPRLWRTFLSSVGGAVGGRGAGTEAESDAASARAPLPARAVRASRRPAAAVRRSPSRVRCPSRGQRPAHVAVDSKETTN